VQKLPVTVFNSQSEGGFLMLDHRTAPYGIFLLRLTLGALFLAHVAIKLFIFTPAGTAQFFGSLGLPPTLAYLVIVWELAGAVALILGVWPRFAAVALVPILLGAIVTVHGAAGFLFYNPNGGWEFPALWIVGLVAVAAIGDGAFAMLPTPAGSPSAQTRATA
jgi:putative oxidoreductase